MVWVSLDVLEVEVASQSFTNSVTETVVKIKTVAPPLALRVLVTVFEIGLGVSSQETETWAEAERIKLARAIKLNFIADVYIWWWLPNSSWTTRNNYRCDKLYINLTCYLECLIKLTENETSEISSALKSSRSIRIAILGKDNSELKGLKFSGIMLRSHCPVQIRKLIFHCSHNGWTSKMNTASRGIGLPRRFSGSYAKADRWESFAWLF